MFSFFFTGGNADIPHLWRSQNAPFMQAVHFAFSIGALVSPIATGPFLYRKINTCREVPVYLRDQGYVNDLQNFQQENISLQMNTRFDSGSSKLMNNNQLTNVSHANTCSGYHFNNVQFAFLISAIISLSASIGFIYIFLKLDFDFPKENHNPKEEVKMGQTCPPKVNFPFKILFLALLAVLVACESVVEESFPSFFMAFGIHYLNWTTQTNVIAVSVFWAAFGFGRFFGILVVSCCNSTTMLTIYLISLVFAFLGFLLSTYFMFIPLIWLLLAVIGFSMSVIFPTVLTWTTEHVAHVSGKVSGMFMTAASLGGMIFPPLIGNLMEYLHPMWYAYVLTITIGFALLMFVIANFLKRFMLQNRKKSLTEFRLP